MPEEIRRYIPPSEKNKVVYEGSIKNVNFRLSQPEGHTNVDRATALIPVILEVGSVQVNGSMSKVALDMQRTKESDKANLRISYDSRTSYRRDLPGGFKQIFIVLLDDTDQPREGFPFFIPEEAFETVKQYITSSSTT